MKTLLTHALLTHAPALTGTPSSLEGEQITTVGADCYAWALQTASGVSDAAWAWRVACKVSYSPSKLEGVAKGRGRVSPSEI